jgi:hypothetical protein
MEGTTGNLHDHKIAASNTKPIYWGDPVNLNGGYVQEASGAASGANFDILGVFQGCFYEEADGTMKFARMWDGLAGRTNIRAQIAYPSGSTFLIAGDPAGGYDDSDIGTRKGVIYAAGTKTGFSQTVLGAHGATVATGPLMVIQKVDLPEKGDYFEVAVVRSQLFPQVTS